MSKKHKRKRDDIDMVVCPAGPPDSGGPHAGTCSTCGVAIHWADSTERLQLRVPKICLTCAFAVAVIEGGVEIANPPPAADNPLDLGRFFG